LADLLFYWWCNGITVVGFTGINFESGLFAKMKDMAVKRGNLLMLVNPRERFARYLKCIFIGLPTWFVGGILIGFSDKFALEMHIKEPVDVGKAILFFYVAVLSVILSLVF
jgi:hypothetical protein